MLNDCCSAAGLVQGPPSQQFLAFEMASTSMRDWTNARGESSLSKKQDLLTGPAELKKFRERNSELGTQTVFSDFSHFLASPNS